MSSRSSLMLLLLLLLAAGGCATTITPPPHPDKPVAVYVTDYGRHSSLLLPDPAGHFNEYAFGDWDWFALGETSMWDGFRALFFFSRAATLGRRQLALPEDASADQVARIVGAARAMRLDVSAPKVDALRERLDALFERNHNTVTWEPGSAMWFVRDDDGHYSGLHNCNHVTKAWLQSLGCRVRGSGMTSEFVLKPAEGADRAARDAVAGVP